jgi:predicted  nucleic acid-binding Zn-ribbon protein
LVSLTPRQDASVRKDRRRADGFERDLKILQREVARTDTIAHKVSAVEERQHEMGEEVAEVKDVSGRLMKGFSDLKKDVSDVKQRVAKVDERQEDGDL